MELYAFRTTTPNFNFKGVSPKINIPKAELEAYINQNYTVTRLADKYGVTINKIRKILKEYGLKTFKDAKTEQIESLKNDIIYDVNSGLTRAEISEKYNIPIYKLDWIKRKYDIRRYEKIDDNTMKSIVLPMIEQGRKLKDVVAKLGVSPQTASSWVEKNLNTKYRQAKTESIVAKIKEGLEQNLTTAQISKKLGISQDKVEGYIARHRKTFNIPSKKELIEIGMKKVEECMKEGLTRKEIAQRTGLSLVQVKRYKAKLRALDVEA